ncbi:hypothetical protein P4234_16215 [Pseudomonas aeruginosa]|nr:hypothetical protein [Pseudomonas aeruginosa]
MAGLEEASGGSIALDGTDITDTPPAKRYLAMVSPDLRAVPAHDGARGTSPSPLTWPASTSARSPPRSTPPRILELQALLERKPRQLSGGQRQRWRSAGRSRNPKIFLRRTAVQP